MELLSSDNSRLSGHMSDINHVRRNIVLLIAGTIVAGMILLAIATPELTHLSPQATRRAQTSLSLFTFAFSAILLAIVHVFLRPISAAADFLRADQVLPSRLAQQARTRAFNAPLFLFVTSISLVSLITITSDVFGLLTKANYSIVLRFSRSLLIIVISMTVALFVSIISRRILRPVLLVTADLAEDIGRRYEIRTRLFLVILAFSLFIFHLLAALAFNRVYQAAHDGAVDRFRQWADDVAYVAPLIDDEALFNLVGESKILNTFDANVELLDSSGRRLFPRTQQFSLSTSQSSAPEPPTPEYEHIALDFPIERDGETLKLNITFAFAPENASQARKLLPVLIIYGTIILGLALLSAHYIADDVTRDLKYVTSRLIDFAHQGQAGARLYTLSLDEIGDLIAALDKVRASMFQQQNELNQRVEQMHELLDASLVLANSVGFQQMLDRICDAARDITGSAAVTLLLYQPDADAFVCASQAGDQAVSDSACARETWELPRAVLADRQAVLITDALGHPLVASSVFESGIRSLMVVPVISRTQALGVLCASTKQPDAYDSENLRLVSALANQAAPAIENALLLEETMNGARALESRARNLLMINRISTDLTVLLDPYHIFNVTARHMVELMDADHCSIATFNEKIATGVIVAEYPELGAVGSRLAKVENPAIEHVLTTKEVLAITDIRQAPLMEPVREVLDRKNIRALLIAPLIARGEVIGTITLDIFNRPYEFSGEEQELCRTVAAQAAIAAANARLLHNTRQQSRALTRKSQELAEESALLDAVLTNMADGLVVTDLSGRIILSNPSFRTMAGQPANRSLRERLLDEVIPAFKLQDVIVEAITDPESVAAADMASPDGRVLRASASALQMKQEVDPTQAGRLTGVVTVLRDITHQVEVDRMKTDFISAVSHELRTPLTSILGFASLIERAFRRRIAPLVDVADDAETLRAAERILGNLSIIESESKRLTRLINDLLDIAKIESGKAEWHMTDVDMADIIRSSVKTAEALSHEGRVEFEIDIEKPLPLILGDRDRLIQVVTNLLSNAIKFTAEGRVIAQSRLWTADLPPPAAFPLGQHIQLPALIVNVSDTGIGIPKKDLPLVFERFRQVGDALTAKPTGTGLGLPISKEIVEHHGGVIWAESQPGLGSRFSFALPVSPEHMRSSPELATQAAKAKRIQPVAEHHRLVEAQQILVVDDEPHIRRLLRQELTDAGYDVIEAADGHAAVNRARLVRPRLIILDLLMPGADGFDVTSRLRADPVTADIPIIVLSVTDEATKALDLGADAYLKKPVDVPGLLEKIALLLKKKRDDASLGEREQSEQESLPRTLNAKSNAPGDK